MLPGLIHGICLQPTYTHKHQLYETHVMMQWQVSETNIGSLPRLVHADADKG